MRSSVLPTPYDGSSKPFTIGLKPLDINTWIEVDAHFPQYLAEKRRLYAEQTQNVLVAEDSSKAAQQEVLDLIRVHMQTHFSGMAGSSLDIPDAAPWHRIAQAGLLVQEDLVIMGQSSAGWRLTAASVCFPSAWNLREKFGKPMHDIHAPVPGFGEGTRNAGLIDRMFDKLRVEQPVIRWNWSFYGDSRLYHPASDNQMKRRFGKGPITSRVILRLERQTLRKLPKSGDILFTIRIHTNPLEVLASHTDGKALAAGMAEQVANLSAEEVAYKGLVGEHERLLARIREFM
jgi:dimethylamine monooxygenase subunit A